MGAVDGAAPRAMSMHAPKAIPFRVALSRDGFLA